MDHIAKVSSFCMDQQKAPYLDVAGPDPQFGMNEEYDACRVEPQILHLLVEISPVLAYEYCIFDL